MNYPQSVVLGRGAVQCGKKKKNDNIDFSFHITINIPPMALTMALMKD